jgi:hypothetical protein
MRFFSGKIKNTQKLRHIVDSFFFVKQVFVLFYFNMAQNNIVDRFLNVGHEPAETLMPVVDYETTDLVSLEDALLHNLDAMIQTAKRNLHKPADGFTPDEL